MAIELYRLHNTKKLVTHIKKENIYKSRKLSVEKQEKLKKNFYFIDNSYETTFNIICNDLDVVNDGLLDKIHRILSGLSNESYWLVGHAGEGKSTILIRLAIETTMKDKSSFYINFKNMSITEEYIKDMIKYIKNNTTDKAYIYIDNPEVRIDLIEIFFKQIVEYDFQFIIILTYGLSI
jgi:predicted ATP-dependent serine protease